MSKLNHEVIESAYGWTIDVHGEICGLISGDMGYEGTGIFLEGPDLEIWNLGVKAWTEQQSDAKKDL